ncbi:MAG: tRNA (adenosine(37)-N6)-threonylcarbamoyltransferase complex dimerization subunit type 1 TsaB, partial [Pirellulaceae bacterium]|nr:tRNA (adenosine(37)-N6)-threonylcarbamoyltransferase complex dimerization subunit type 1 TsaB [Pirellulaceae bacterium]
VAVTVGPGSFTGLRVGVTTAKAFAYSVAADILGINTLDAIAAATDDNVRRVAVAVDAQRGQVVAAQFSRGDDGWFRREGPTRLLDIEAWLATLPDATTVSGPILKKLGVHVPERLQVASSACWRPTAAMVARLAVRDYAAGRRDDLWTLLPVYSRQSAAEEKHDARP